MDSRTMLSDEFPSKVDAVQIVLIDGDELRRCIGLDRCESVSSLTSLSSSVRHTHCDVIRRLKRAQFSSLRALPVKVVQRLDV